MSQIERHNLFRVFGFLAIVCAGLILLAPLNAQSVSSSSKSVSLNYSGTGGYTLVERTNLRRYVNGKYVGLTSREVRSFISPSERPVKISAKAAAALGEGQWYDGSFYVMEETMRNASNVAAGIHDSILSEFFISSEGKMTMVTDNGYPSFRSFPAFPANKISIGESWTGEAERAVDPLNKGIVTRMPMYVLYTLADEEAYHNENVYRIKAMWQTNYSMRNFDPKGDSTLQKAVGGHKADILVRKSTGDAILIIDNVDEQFTYSDGGSVVFKGTITLFTEFPPAIEHDKIINSLNRIAKVTPEAERGVDLENSGSTNSGSGNAENSGDEKVVAAAQDNSDDKQIALVAQNSGSTGSTENQNESAVQNSSVGKLITAGPGEIMLGHNVVSDANKNNMVVEKTPAGLRLSVRDVRFKSDSADILPEEKSRLNQIADVLKMAPNSQFLIEGHTASVGKPSGEQTLSEQRAHRIAEELSSLGVKSSAFICRGWGGNKPVASNDTPEGRAQNRRVEITILE